MNGRSRSDNRDIGITGGQVTEVQLYLVSQHCFYSKLLGGYKICIALEKLCLKAKFAHICISDE